MEFVGFKGTTDADLRLALRNNRSEQLKQMAAQAGLSYERFVAEARMAVRDAHSSAVGLLVTRIKNLTDLKA